MRLTILVSLEPLNLLSPMSVVVVVVLVVVVVVVLVVVGGLVVMVVVVLVVLVVVVSWPASAVCVVLLLLTTCTMGLSPATPAGDHTASPAWQVFNDKNPSKNHTKADDV